MHRYSFLEFESKKEHFILKEFKSDYIIYFIIIIIYFINDYKKDKELGL